MLNRKFALLLIIFVICALMFDSPFFSEPIKSTTDSSLLNKENMRADSFISGQVIVALKNGYEISLSAPNIFSELASSFEILTRAKKPSIVNNSSVVPADNIVLLQLKNSEKQAVLNAIYRLRSCPDVKSVQPDYMLKLCSTAPNDSYYNKLYALEKIDAPQAWEKTTGNPSVVVGVIDTGIDYNHPDLKENIWRNPGEIPDNKIDDDNNGYIDDVYGWNFVADNNNPMDNNFISDNYHGTHVAGIIAGMGNNSQGITGVAWKVKLAALKIGDASGGNNLSDAIKAVDYANKMGFPITNNSYGFDPYDSIMKDTIGKGGLFVVASGNGWTDSNNDGSLTDDERNNDINPHYPACYDCPNVISVAASDINDNLVFDSRFGRKTVHLVAPGQDIWSCMKDNRYQPKSGTSMSAPYVAGAAALLKSYNPELTAIQIKNSILNNVDKIPELRDKVSSGGRLNVSKAMSSISPPTPLNKINFSINKSNFWHTDSWQLDISTSSAIVNQTVTNTVWKKNGNSYSFYTSYIMGKTDANGKLVITGTFDSSLVGEWKEQVNIGNLYSNEIFFKVAKAPSQSINFSVNKSSFGYTDSWQLNISTSPAIVNQTVTNTVWKKNGNSYSFYTSYIMGKTDTNGKLVNTGTFNSSLVGEWKEQVSIGNLYSNEITFRVDSKLTTQ